MLKKYIVTTLLMMVLVAQVVTAGDVVMIVNNSVQESSLSASNIQNIFLGKKTSWSDHTKIIPVMLPTGSARDAFLADIMKMSNNDFKNTWVELIFAGKGNPPKTLTTEEEIVNFVTATKGAVGFVSSGTSVGNNKVIPVN